MVGADAWVRSGTWERKGGYPLQRRVFGRKAGILGLGRIGFEVGKRLTGFGMDIAYSDLAPRAGTPDWQEDEGTDHEAVWGGGIELPDLLDGMLSVVGEVDLQRTVRTGLTKRGPDAEGDDLKGIAAYASSTLSLGLFNLQQVGLSYQFSPDGRYTAIKLNMRSWFTR